MNPDVTSFALISTLSYLLSIIQILWCYIQLLVWVPSWFRYNVPSQLSFRVSHMRWSGKFIVFLKLIIFFVFIIIFFFSVRRSIRPVKREVYSLLLDYYRNNIVRFCFPPFFCRKRPRMKLLLGFLWYNRVQSIRFSFNYFSWWIWIGGGGLVSQAKLSWAQLISHPLIIWIRTRRKPRYCLWWLLIHQKHSSWVPPTNLWSVSLVKCAIAIF